MKIPHPRHSAYSAELLSFRTYEFYDITVIRRRSHTHQGVSKVNITRLNPASQEHVNVWSQYPRGHGIIQKVCNMWVAEFSRLASP